MLAIEIEYLLGRVVATDSNRRDDAEWPPHPSRLFSALVDAFSDDPGDVEAERALRWLEQLPPPAIFASVGEAVRLRRLVKHFVPINDEMPSQRRRLTASPLPEQRTRQERFFPAVVPDEPKVQFIWQDAHPKEAHRLALGRLAHRVSYLGHSSSPVRVDLADSAQSPTLEPDEDGDTLLRVMGHGRFDRLARVHELRQRNETAQPPRGREVSYGVVKESIPRGPFGQHELIVIEEGPRLDLRATAPIVARLREALLARLSLGIPEILSGHQPNGAPTLRPHLALLPLANVAHAHADGTVKGFAALLPRAADADVRDRFLNALQEVKTLHLGTLGLLRLRMGTAAESPASLRFLPRYAKRSRFWMSVTPVVLSQHPRPNKQLTEEEVVARDLERLGLPRPTEIRLGCVSVCSGAPMVSEFSRGELKQLKGRLLRHAWIAFGREVAGPIVVGAGRFVGFGVCLPFELG